MSTPIKPSGLNALNQANASSGTPALGDVMSRLSGQQATAQGTQPAFSQWLDKHKGAPEPEAAKPAGKPMAAATAPRSSAPGPAAVTPEATRPNPEPLQAGPKQARPMASSNKMENKAEAKVAAKTTAPQSGHDQSVKASEQGEDADKSEASTDAQSDDDKAVVAAPVAAGAAEAREPTPPEHLQVGDSAGMMAWLAHLVHAQPARQGGAAPTEARGQQPSQVADAGALPRGAGEQAPAQMATISTIALDNPAWQSAKGDALQGLQADKLLSPAGVGAEHKVDTTALASMLTGGGAGVVSTRGEATGMRHESATLNTPFGSTDFAQALAEKVSMWVNTAQTDGPMTAELHLNPAEMGPINVKISLDGQSAHVDFAATAVETRRAIEDSMPLLSNALDSVGLSLTGGDVSSQTPQQQSFAQQMAQEGAQRGSGGAPRGGLGAGDGREAEVGSLRQVSVPRPGRPGGLDLYA